MQLKTERHVSFFFSVFCSLFCIFKGFSNRVCYNYIKLYVYSRGKNDTNIYL